MLLAKAKKALRMLLPPIGNEPTSTELRARDERSARSICARVARGNVSLQQGKYITVSQLAMRREECLRFHFPTHE
ncbi:MAG: hypothetical protein LBP75_05995 [Planctomycetota bacterium]|nr:hypothetical protein [Planctomycetota bacterium]